MTLNYCVQCTLNISILKIIGLFEHLSQYTSVQMHFANIKQCHVFLSTDTCRVYLRSLLYVFRKKKKTIFSHFNSCFASHSFQYLLCIQGRKMCTLSATVLAFFDGLARQLKLNNDTKNIENRYSMNNEILNVARVNR